MAITAVQQILNEVDSRANNITIANGYKTSMAKKEASKLTAFVGGDWPQFSYWIVSKAKEEFAYDIDKNNLSIIVGYFDKTRDRPFSEMASNLEADAVVAMNRATTAPALSDNASPDLGGLVSEFTHEDTEYIIGEGEIPWGGALLAFDVEYFSPKDDPYTIIDDSDINA